MALVTGFNYGVLLKQKWDAFFDTLNDEQLGKLMRAVTKMAFYSEKQGEKLKGDDPAVYSAYMIIGTEVMQDIEKYYEKCEKNRANAKRQRSKKAQKDDSELDIDAYEDPDWGVEL